MALYAFDGTWNKEHKDPEHVLRNTNVKKFFDLYEGTRNKYVAGVGTRFGIFGRVLGGLFGFGGYARLDTMYRQLCENYVTGHDKINVIGFSRGAALALSFVNRIVKRGIRDPKTGEVVESKPTIQFVGLWDVVGSFGIALDIGPIPFQKWELGHDLDLPRASVEHCFHAMALDERRRTFMITRVAGAYEVWFRGVHSDVGGGNANPGLSDVALRWMAFKAMGCGLPGFTEARILAATSSFAPNAPVSPPHKYDVTVKAFRPLRSGDRYHYTVTPCDGCNAVRTNMVMESTADEIGTLLVV